MTEKLSERVERLEGPDREIDCLIGVAVGWFVTEPNKGWPDRMDYIDIRGGTKSYPGGGFDQLVPKFSASLDAAMSLARHDSEAIVILMGAVAALEKDGWPKGEWAKKLARYVTAQALKARGL